MSFRSAARSALFLFILVVAACGERSPTMPAETPVPVRADGHVIGNSPPVIIVDGPTEPVPSGPVVIEFRVGDPDGDPLTGTASASGQSMDFELHNNVVPFPLPLEVGFWDDGTYPVVITATDAFGHNTTVTFEVVVLNRAPVVNIWDFASTLHSLCTGPATPVTIAGFMSEEDGVVESLQALSAEGDVLASAAPGSGSGLFTLTPALPVGANEVTVAATDDDGAVGTDVVTVFIGDPDLPTLTVDEVVTRVTPPSRRMVPVLRRLRGDDLCRGTLPVELTVTADQPIDASDWAVQPNGDGTVDVLVRAARDRGVDRTYTIHGSTQDAPFPHRTVHGTWQVVISSGRPGA